VWIVKSANEFVQTKFRADDSTEGEVAWETIRDEKKVRREKNKKEGNIKGLMPPSFSHRKWSATIPC
jgi:hypothetical protein